MTDNMMMMMMMMMMGNPRRQSSSSSRRSSSSSSAGRRLRAAWILDLFFFLGVLYASSSSSLSMLAVVQAEEGATSSVSELEVEVEPRKDDENVCAPPVDCSTHEHTIKELTESLATLQGKFDGLEATSRKELAEQQRQSQEACQARLDEARSAHQTELATAVDECRTSCQNDSNNKIVEEKDERIVQLRSELDDARSEAGTWQKQYDDVSREHEKLTAQLETTTSQLQSLLKDHEQVAQEKQQLTASLRDMEEHAARAAQEEAKRTRGWEKELRNAKAQLQSSQDALFETRQELHDVWERYVAIRDAWWNVPSRWEAVAAWAVRQWQRIDAQVDRLIVATKPHLERFQRVATTTLETVLRKVVWFVNVVQLVINDWFLPNWRLHVQPHLGLAGRVLAEQARVLWALAQVHWGTASAWAAEQWSNLLVATAPQREQVAILLQPTLDVLHAQFAPVASALMGAWTAATTAMAESTWLESAAQNLYRLEFQVVSMVATATGVAHDYLVLQNAPAAAIWPFQWVHHHAAAYVSESGNAAGGAPPAQFLRNVVLTVTTATTLILTVLWWVLKTRRPSSPPRRRPPPPTTPPPPPTSYRSSPKSGAGIVNSKISRNKTPSPDLLTEASSIPDHSLRTSPSQPR